MFHAKDVFASYRFRELTEGLYEPAVVGFVTQGDPYSVLVATRAKETDPLRRGQWELPAGHVERVGSRVESPLEAARREVMEETGTTTGRAGIYVPGAKDHIVLKEGDHVTSVIEPDGRIWAFYKDSGKMYDIRIVSLDPHSSPQENAESDARDPRYMNFEDALAQRNRFTPIDRVFLDICSTWRYGRPLATNGDIKVKPEPISQFLSRKPL